jgi:hypothetical protein
MSRIDTFTFRVNADERRILAALADYLNRSQSDTLRLLVRAAGRELLPNAPAPTARQADDAAPRGEGVKHAANN